MRLTPLQALLLAGTLLALAPLAQAETHVVTIEGMAFVPARITVQRGDTIVWRNSDLTPHTATAGGAFDSKNLAPQASWSWVAQAPGRWAYVCLYHPTMKGEVVVQ